LVAVVVAATGAVVVDFVVAVVVVVVVVVGGGGVTLGRGVKWTEVQLEVENMTSSMAMKPPDPLPTVADTASCNNI
jgi:hypothetical protein